MSKQYGLIIPNKNKAHTIQPVSTSKPSIFGDDSDSDNGASAKPTGLQKSVKKKDVITQNRAVEEDPTVYQYDEIYDEMEQKRKESKLSRKDLDKKPKYIGRLIKAAERRKHENERRIERQVQKEREAEGEEFRDKESFVTSAYKKKLEEMKALEEQEKREEYLESIGDVRKQGNLDGFYRHLYDQKVLYEDKKGESDDDIKKEPPSDKDSDGDGHGTKNSDSEEENTTVKSKENVKKRKYRSRKKSDDESGEEIETEVKKEKKEHLPSNLDADSDFSIDSSDSEDEKDDGKKSPEKPPEPVKLEEKGNVVSDNAALAKKTEDGKTEKDKPKENGDVKEEVEEIKPKKPKVDIWKKRTVGEVFDEALRRYFERKALREASG